jgi:hypothetical protein
MEKSKIKCFKCAHLIIKPHEDWGNAYSCKKMWFGGCSEPSKYSANMCAQTNDYQKKQNQQLTLF